MAWRYLTNTGIVTDSCFPYTSGDGSVPHCLHGKCSDSEDYVKYRCQDGSVVEATTPDQIKSEIYANGPMETAFTVYSDFMNY
jgi:cathepsin B